MRSEGELQTGKGRAETGREKRGRGGSLDILWVRDLRHLRFETQNKQPHKNKSKILL